ncbi:SulP family inorganic anion transporter [Exilibacterium tricleocarpae]|uniref:SulP family inorganic anion transporter n=1 Tax=Exilibacterium tricleocarpae TaxID=2591008 RepID=UPI001C555529|nr:SulP family inorganic anion transporter [Exilibacterium tricleocarpae]
MTWGRQVTGQSLTADLLAGLTGAVIVLPQGVAYALIAGLPPEYGLYTAIITPVIAGLFGSSVHLISGPTAPISIVVLSVTSTIAPPGSTEFIPTVLTLTLLCGLIQFGLGLARMGTLVNFISHTVIIGFAAGAALLICTSQLKYFFGVPAPKGASFIDTWAALWHQLGNINPYAAAIALITMATTLAVKRIDRRLPYMLVGMVAGSLACWLIDGATRGIQLVGPLPGSLPGPSMPDLSIDTISALLPGAVAVAVLGLVEAVSVARAIAIRSGQRIDGNREFVGQGLSNLCGSFFSCYAGSGSFTRSGANYDAGARTPLAGVFAALILVLVLLLLPQITAYLPLPAMAGAIVLIAWNLIDFHHIREILRSNRQETSVLLVTFASTLLVELEYAIYLGVLLSLLLYLHRSSKPRLMEVAPKIFATSRGFRSIERFGLDQCPQLKVVRIDGSIFFGAVDHIQRELQRVADKYPEAKHILLLCPGIHFIDIAGAEMLINEARRFKDKGGALSYCAMKNTVIDELESINYMDKLGRENFFVNADEALHALVPRLEQAICENCRHRVFLQCPQQK